jgi:hypothetical protein
MYVQFFYFHSRGHANYNNTVGSYGSPIQVHVSRRLLSHSPIAPQVYLCKTNMHADNRKISLSQETEALVDVYFRDISTSHHAISLAKPLSPPECSLSTRVSDCGQTALIFQRFISLGMFGYEKHWKNLGMLRLRPAIVHVAGSSSYDFQSPAFMVSLFLARQQGRLA